ncbi:lysozyme [Amycolatopsis jiangsuensis]|uniref:lysozyme n=1 Tax=Amycolatopsis jiangsuensis TaxID=1181879 RepID=A0A840J0D7_9PSEU|nr:GH25 family lysozyme M1 (1,4-beta-N-acetylmuramidase) [Amycolatopsis jiangsuensis]
MKSRHPLLRWSAALAAGFTCVSLCLSPAASAAPSYAGAEGNYAGSQIAKHEGVAGSPVEYSANAQLLGHDVSGHQGAVDWVAAARAGAKFVYVKATEGTGFISPQFAQQYDGSYGAGLIRGSYHFARPDVSDGAAQANYFLAHGGGWSKDGKTLPGALDAEYNPYGETCYGKDAAGMVAWIKAFSDTYRARTGRPPTIYTSTSWWKRCTGNSAAFGANPLWLARYNSQVGELPAGWGQQTIWQFANSGTLPGDQNWLNGSTASLHNLAIG